MIAPGSHHWLAAAARIRPHLPPGMLLPTCATCGLPCWPGGPGPRCDGCWEVESRLEGYLRDGGPTALEVLTQAIAGWARGLDGPERGAGRPEGVPEAGDGGG